METINSMAASAAKAVWGEDKPSTEEPVSGRYGDTTKGEPYDAGNIEPISANTGDDASTNGLTNGHVDGAVIGGAKLPKTTGTAPESSDTPHNSSADLKAKSGPRDSSKGQGDTRSPEDPKTNPKSAPMDVNDAPGEGLNQAQELDGPGPKPLEEVAKENGGDAGNDSKSSIDKASNTKDTKGNEEDEHKSAGTGEKYVHSSGLQADGGDFDATNPGAGREADRLMDEKGIHNPTDPDSTPDQNGGSPSSGKKSLGQKIKDKLHRH